MTPTVVLSAMAAGLLGPTQAADPARPAFEFTEVRRAGDAAAAEVGDGRVVLAVVSTNGIGAVTARPSAGGWPREAVIRFRYGTGRPFESLEGLRLTTGRLTAAGSSADSGRFRFGFLGGEPKPGGRPAEEADPAGTLDVRVERTEGGLVVRLPAGLLAGDERLTVEWVDAYRR